MPTRDEALAQLTGPGAPFEIGEAEVRGHRMRVYVTAPPSLRALWEASATHGDAPYLIYQDEVLTYAQAHEQVRALAAHLAAHGISKGDRVGIGMRNYPEWVVAFWACHQLGAIVVSLNAWWTAGELHYGLADSGTAALIVDGERYERLAPDVLGQLPDLRHVIVSRYEGELGPSCVRWADALAAPATIQLPAVELHPDDDATILYTSGTTGSPKGAVGSHRNHVTNVMNTLLNGAVQAMTSPPPPEPVTPRQTVALWTFPFFHIAGVTGICVVTATGGALVTQYKWDPGEALELIERHRVSVVAGVPTVVRSLLEHPDAPHRDLSSLAGISQGGSPVPPDSIARIETSFGGRVLPGNGYGLTETTSAVVVNSGAAYFAKKDSVGLPVPVADVRIVDDQGRDVAPGEVGELWVRGPNNVRGYWGKPEATAQAFVDGWFRTGDAARVDDDGYIYIVDRLKDVVLRGGENVYCAEVEAAIFEHPAVADVAVIGLPHEALGEEVCAVVNLKPGASLGEDELRGFLTGRLAPFKIPSKVVVREREIPRNATGKVLKRELRAELSGS